ncbi:glycoside hydrolase family 76 protein [Candidatus Omnitrophota bacterium]
MIRKNKNSQRRKYIRLDSVFPVDFRLITQDNQTFLSDWIQGFTSNISRGGICVSVNNFKAEFVALIEKGDVNLLLNIQVPLSGHPTPARTKPAWIEPVTTQPGQYIIGLCYQEISPLANKQIVGYAWSKYLIPRISAGLLIILTLSISLSGYFNWRLRHRNLVNRLVEVLEDSKIARQGLDKINQEKEELNSRLAQVQEEIKNAETGKKQLSQELLRMKTAIEEKSVDQAAVTEEARRLTVLIKRLRTEKGILEEELFSVQQREGQAVDNLLVLDKKQAVIQQETFDNMHQWLVRHQNLRTGLISSFEGDSDIANWGFTYDQALVACVYSYSADFQRAERILDFFKYRAKQIGGAFVNAYYVNDGQPSEYVVHCGPNIWLGLASIQYTHATGDNRYLDLAKQIGNWVIQIQSQDKEGGIRGGPEVKWYATEHNLDAYSFLTMLYEKTGNQRYRESAEKVVHWLLRHAYDRPDVPIKRGKGDSTIATDTYAWSIAALGPGKLEQIGMLPDDIMKFAEENCKAEADFPRPGRDSVRIEGFDFAAQRNLARGGVISCEWTAQMILSFKIMADYYRQRQLFDLAAAYQSKADRSLLYLSQMVISSPSPSGQGRGCLPYASDAFVDTGHGWITPKGSSTGSVAGTAYALLAYYGNNPLQLKQK